MKYILLAALILCSCLDLLAQSDDHIYHWVSHLHGWGQETGYEILIQPSGDLLVLGAFADSIIFFPDTVALSDTELFGYFLAQYDTCGALMWYHIWTGSASDNAGGIQLAGMDQDQKGNVYVAFSFLNTLTIEGKRLTSTSGNALLRLDHEGHLVSFMDPITHVHGNATPYALDLAVSAHGTIALTGVISVNPSLGPGYIDIGEDRIAIDLDSLIGYYRHQAWLGVYASSGEAIWARGTHAPNGAESRTVAFDQQERVYWAGHFDAGTTEHGYGIHFGSDSDSLSVDHGPSGFLMAYDSVGHSRWVKALEVSPIAPDTIGEIRLWELDVSPSDEIYIVGRLSNVVWLDSMQIPQQGFPPSDDGSIWISLIKVSPDGEPQWSREITSTRSGNLYLNDLGFDGDQNVYVGGSFLQDYQVENVSIQNGHSEPDGLIASISPTGSLRWATAIEGDSRYSTMVRSLASSHDGRLFVTGKIDLPAQIGSFSLMEPSGQAFPRFGGDFFLTSYGQAVDSLACYCVSQSPVEAAFDWTILPHSQRVQFHNQSIGGTQARWSFGDGQESEEWSPTHLFADFDTFQVCVDVWDICSQSTICRSIPIIQPLEFACDPRFWRIGPNPSAEKLTIEFGGLICDTYQLNVFDTRGRCMGRYTLEPGRTEAFSLHTQTWPEGIYYLHVHGRYAEYSVRLLRID